MIYIENKLEKATKKKKIYESIIDYNSEETQKIIKLIKGKSTQKSEIKELKMKKNLLRISKDTYPEVLKSFTFTFERGSVFDLVVSFDIFFDNKKEIKLIYSLFYYMKKTNTYCLDINPSIGNSKFIKRSIKKIKSVLCETKEGKEYLDNYYKYREYSLIKSVCNEIITINDNYKKYKFYKVFMRKISLKKFKEIINKNNEISMFIPLINNTKKTIIFYKKEVNKEYLEDLLKNKQYKKLALIVKYFLYGGFFIDDNFISAEEKVEEEINKSEVSNYLHKYHVERLNYRYDEKIDIFLNKCLIQNF